MKGWFELSGLDPHVNNNSACGRKRHFSKRGAEEAEKKTKRRPSGRQWRYSCDLCGNWHMTSIPQRSK